MKITKQHCNDVRKSGKRGVNALPIVVNVLQFSSYSVVFRLFCLRHRINIETGFDLVTIFVMTRCTVGQLAITTYGNGSGSHRIRVYRRVLTLSKRGLIDYDGKYASVSDKGLQALQSIEIDPELTSYWLDLQSRIEQSIAWHERRLGGVREKK